MSGGRIAEYVLPSPIYLTKVSKNKENSLRDVGTYCVLPGM